MQLKKGMCFSSKCSTFAAMKIETRRRIIAFILLAVMLSMQISVSLHHHQLHTSVEETCADCLHHVHHAGHLTTQTVDFHECVLCQLHSLPYLVASVLHLAVAICIIHTVYVVSSEKCRNRASGLHSPRSPPYSLCF